MPRPLPKRITTLSQLRADLQQAGLSHDQSRLLVAKRVLQVSWGKMSGYLHWRPQRVQAVRFQLLRKKALLQELDSKWFQ